MSATLDRSAVIGQRAITISGPAARQAAHAHLHEIECVERLGLDSLMRALLC